MPGALPPLEKENISEELDAPKRRKKKKKPVTGGAGDAETAKDETTTPGDELTNENAATAPEDDAHVARVKKKRKKKAAANTDPANETAADVTDGNTTEAPSTKPAPKKKKRAKKATQNAEDQLDMGLPEEFQDLQDDFIDATSKPNDVTETERSNEQLVTSKTRTSNRLFVERKTGFASSTFGKMETLHSKGETQVEEILSYEGETVKAAVWTQKVFHVIGVFIHGLTGGLALMQLVFVWFLVEFNKESFVEFYKDLALPFICTFYLLITLSLLTTLDKWDLAKPQGGFFRTLVTCNSGMWASIAFLVALILSCVISTYEDKIQLASPFKNLWYTNYTVDFVKGNRDAYKANVTATSDVHVFEGQSDLRIYRALVIARTAFAVFGWLYVSIQPHKNELIENLEEMELGYEENLR